MDAKVQNQFAGAILNYMRKCIVVDHDVYTSDSESLELLMGLEEKHLRRWVPASSIIIEVDRRIQAVLPPAVVENIADSFIERPLPDVVPNATLEKIAAESTEFFATIPYPSKFWIDLSGVRLQLPEPLAFGPISLRQVGGEPAGAADDSRAYFPGLAAPPLRGTSVVLEFEVSGYSRQRISDSSPQQALARAKEFLVLGEALEVFDSRRMGTAVNPTVPLCEVKPDPPLRWIRGMPLHASRHIGGYRLGRAITRRPLTGEAAKKTKRTTEAVPAAEHGQLIKQRARVLAKVFDPAAEKATQPLRAAAQWYFDSRAEDNETTGFLFACLGIEALLGDSGQSEGLGVMRLLANRLAYLLGGNRQSRDNLISEFTQFYAKRSALVHGREVRLQPEDHEWLLTARKWLILAMRQELSTIAID